MVDLIATKSMTYATRRLKADVQFSARPRDARLLVAIGKARYADTAAIATESDEDELTTLRAAYQEMVGKKAFHGWDAPALRAKIAEA